MASLCLGASAFAQDVPPVPAATPAAAASLAPAEATAAWLATVPAETRARSEAYFEGGYWLILWNFLVTAAISLLLLTTRLSAYLRNRAEQWARWKWLQTVLYVISFVTISAILAFPLTWYQYFVREHAYGMATQTFPQWFGEQLLAFLINLVAFSVLFVILYAVFRRAPRTWWLWATAVCVLFFAFFAMIAPVYIEPLFNTYKPLTQPELRDPILAMARANQIPVDQVFEVDASRQTKRISANVAGFLGTTRIALNDNLLKQCSLPEIRLVMAHEMGHYILGHTVKLLFAFGVLFFVSFGLTRLAFDVALRRWGATWGVRGISDPAGLPLLSLIIAAIFLVLTPVTNTIIRTIEHEADAFALNTAREPDAAATVALKLGAYRKLEPTQLEEIIFFDHPSGRSRIRRAMDWKAADLPPGGD